MASRGPGNRLGVLGALLGIEGSGDSLRRFAGEDAIERLHRFQCLSGTFSALSTILRVSIKCHKRFIDQNSVWCC
jgi:hypothetical protein